MITLFMMEKASKSNVDTGETYMDLPSEATLLSPGEKQEEHRARDATLKKFLERNHVLHVLSRSVTELYTRYTAMRPHPDPVEYFLEVLAEFVSRDPQQDQLDSDIEQLKVMLAEIQQDCLTIQEKLNTRMPEALKVYRDYSSSESGTDDNAAKKLGGTSSQSLHRQKATSLAARWEDTSKNAIPPLPSTARKFSYGRKSRASGRQQVQESLAWLMENQRKD